MRKASDILLIRQKIEDWLKETCATCELQGSSECEGHMEIRAMYMEKQVQELAKKLEEKGIGADGLIEDIFSLISPEPGLGLLSQRLRVR